MPNEEEITRFYDSVQRIIDDFIKDKENMHGLLDDLCWLELRRLGYGRAIKEIKNQDLWYA